MLEGQNFLVVLFFNEFAVLASQMEVSDVPVYICHKFQFDFKSKLEVVSSIKGSAHC